MSRASAAPKRGELVDCGSWSSGPTAAMAAAAPSPARAGASGSSSASSKARSAAPSRPAHAAASSAIGSHWLSVEPVTLAVEPAHASDRPLYCLSVNASTGAFVVGGADHSLREYSLASGTFRRELYSKTSGHTEWVTSCATTPDGRVLSGGMDGKVVLWASSGPRGVDLLSHGASVSRVLVDSRDIGISGSYDKSLKVWSLGSRPKELLTIRTPSAVTAMDWHGSLVVSGGREGQLNLFDVNTGQSVRSLTPAGNAQVLTLQFGSVEAGLSATESIAAGLGTSEHEWIVAAGGADGALRLYDLRSEACIFQKRLSTGKPGSVNDVAFGRGFLVAALADGVLSVLDARAGFETRSVLEGHQAPVQCVRIPSNAPDVVCSAASNGWFTAHDANQDGPRIPAAYALGLTTQGGVSAMWLGVDRVVTAGDDGQPVILQYYSGAQK